MNLLPGWVERINWIGPTPCAPQPRCSLPKSATYYAGRTQFVDTLAAATNMADYGRQRPIFHIGIDTEFRYDSPGIDMGRKQTAHDPRSIHPLLLSIAMSERAEGGEDSLATFVVDLRNPDLIPALVDLFRLPVCFVGHFLQAELFCLLKLGLPEPRIAWDTWAAEKALRLGCGHKKYRSARNADIAEQARAAEESEAVSEASNALVPTCLRYGIEYPMAGDKERLQKSFLEQSDHVPFTTEQLAYAAADAVATARLYTPQVLAATRKGILHHLVQVEMPWVTTNTRMIWRGAKVDRELCVRVLSACESHLTCLTRQLASHGVSNARSHPQLTKFFEGLGLLDLFKRDGRVSFDKDLLKEFAERHPAIPLIRAVRGIYDIQKESVLAGDLTGADGRVHPDHRQLGAETGRQTCRWPNLLGLGRVFRPLVVPEPGRGLGEIDWSQIEVGIAAAVYGDENLVKMFNSDDVYSSMAKSFFADQLSREDISLPGHKFKKQHSTFRNRMKTCTLGLIYGLTPHGLSHYLATTPSEAAALQERFMGMFPTLRRELAAASRHGGRRGYAMTASGLRRYRARDGVVSNWERNWMTNHPVQGTAAVIFKDAGNQLDRLYRQYDAWLILPMHDAFVFEAPITALEDVGELTERVMCETVQKWFPELAPRVDVNISQPERWNKDGHADSVERWIREPTYTF